MTRLRAELLAELLADYETPGDLLGDEGLFEQLKKALLERALGAELSDHLGYEKGDPAGRGTGNNRNGHSDKTVLTEDGEVTLAVPRDRNGSFEPAIVPKGERRLDGFDDRILSLYARGMTVREIRGHLQEIYGIEVSPDLISRVAYATSDGTAHAGDDYTATNGTLSFTAGETSKTVQVPVLDDSHDVVKHALLTPRNPARSMGYRADRHRTHASIIYGRPRFMQAFLRTARCMRSPRHLPRRSSDV